MSNKSWNEEYIAACATASRFLHEYMYDFWTRFQKDPPQEAMQHLHTTMKDLDFIFSVLNPPTVTRAQVNTLRKRGFVPYTAKERERRAKYDKKNPYPDGAKTPDESHTRSAAGTSAGDAATPGDTGRGEEKAGSPAPGALSAPDWREDNPPEYNWRAPELGEEAQAQEDPGSTRE